MNIRKTVLDAHGQLSDCSLKFLEYVEQEPELLKRSNFSVLDALTEAGKPQSWPTFIDKKAVRRLEDAGTNVFDLIRSIPRRIFANDPDKISRYYQVPPDIAEMLLDGADEPHLDRLIGRADFIDSPTGLKCLEYNISAGLGGMWVAYWEPVYSALPLISKFLNRYGGKIVNKNLYSTLLEHLFDCTPDKFLQSENEINIAMAIPGHKEGVDRLKENKYLNQIYKNILGRKRLGAGLEGSILFCDYTLMDIKEDCLYYKNKKVHVLVEMYHGIVPAEIMTVFKAGNTCLINGPITKFMSNKLNLAVLSEHENSDLFNAEERENIKKYIPWTRRTVPGLVTTYGTREINLDSFVFDFKDRLIIKPPMGVSGIDVCIGKNTPGEVWKKAMERAFSEKNWVLQEYVESLPYLYQEGENGCGEHNVAWGLFIFGSRYAGGLLRVLPTGDKNGVINSVRGAEETVLFEVEGPQDKD